MKKEFVKIDTPTQCFEVIIETMEGDGDFYPEIKFEVSSDEIDNIIYKIEACILLKDESNYTKFFDNWPYGIYSDGYCPYQNHTIYYYNKAGMKSEVEYTLDEKDKEQIKQLVAKAEEE